MSDSVWPYLMVFNDKLATRKEVQDFLDTLPEVTYWYACLPSSVFFTATVGAGDISKKVREVLSKDEGARFFITEVPADKQGWMPKNVWRLVNHPEEPRLPA